MIWKICFILSVAALASTFAAVFILNRNKKQRFMTKMNVLFFGFFASVFFLFIPICFTAPENGRVPWLRALLITINKSLRTFSLADINHVSESMRPGNDIFELYSDYMSTVCFFCPFLTVGYLMSFFTRVREFIQFNLAYFRDIYVFSELNRKSLALAQDIFEKTDHVKIIFTGVSDAERKANNDLFRCAENINALCLSGSIQSVKINRHSNSSNVYFYTVKNEVGENLVDALALIGSWRGRQRTNLYVFSDSIESEIALSDADKGMIQVRRVDECRTLISNYLYDKGCEIFRGAGPERDGVRQIHAVIVGLGKLGSGMLKALAWYCQMDGYRLKITAFDKDPRKGDILRAECPELLDELHNGVYTEGESFYDIEIRSAEAGTAAFDQQAAALGDATFVFVALGNDDLNVKAAVKLRGIYERVGIKPKITAVLFDTEKKKLIENAVNFKKTPFAVEYIGDHNSIYSKNVIMNSELEGAALQAHLSYYDEKEFWNFEYNYNSSIATTIHNKAKIFCQIPGAGKSEAELSEDVVMSISLLEHKRWNAYMRSQGYVYSGSPDRSTRNDLGKTHHNLVPFGILNSEDVLKDTKIVLK